MIDVLFLQTGESPKKSDSKLFQRSVWLGEINYLLNKGEQHLPRVKMNTIVTQAANANDAIFGVPHT